MRAACSGGGGSAVGVVPRGAGWGASGRRIVHFLDGRIEADARNDEAA